MLLHEQLTQSEPAATTALLAADLEDIQKYDKRHGGAFYASVTWESTYSCLRSLERRRLIDRFIANNGLYEWVITDRGAKAIEGLE